MNVIIANDGKEILSNLSIELIKNMTGEFDSQDIISTFSNFIYDHMIMDITAIKNYQDITNIQKIAQVLNKEKLIIFIPKGNQQISSEYLSRLVSFGLYNFTSNIEGIYHLLEKPNRHADVSHIEQFISLSSAIEEKVSAGSKIIGIRNITDHAGATTLIYMLKKELERMFGPSIYAIEVNRNDFLYFNDKNMISTRSVNLKNELIKLEHATVILIDLNDHEDDSECSDVLYLLEPSSIKLNKLIRRNRNIFNRLQSKKIILNQSLLTTKDIMDFEYEAKTKVFYSIPPLDDRRSNEVLKGFMQQVGILESKDKHQTDGKIFGLFRR